MGFFFRTYFHTDAMLNDIREERKKKIERLKSAGHEAYPARVKRDERIADVLENWEKFYGVAKELSIVGRVFAIRGQGGVSFFDLKDESGGMQVVFRKDNATEYDLISDVIDIGDFIEATAVPYVTKRNEKSIDAKYIRVITKSLQPIPSEWYGIEDTETRLRKRYLDLLLNPELRELFRKKSAFWQHTRNYLLKNGYLEVETPILEAIPGGADARPFVTHHNALNVDFYLRISPELNLKRLLVAGYEKVFEIGRIFRNEGIDDEHLQDYTQLELYAAYMDYEALMKFIEKMVKQVIQKTFGTLIFSWEGIEIDWGRKWAHIKYYDLLKKELGVDVSKLGHRELFDLARERHVEVDQNWGRGRILDQIYKKTVRPKITQPYFLINPPVDVEPLAKRHRKSQDLVDRFQIVAMGTELGKGFSELNDPEEQRSRFQEQMRLRAAGDDEAQMMDESFVEALEYGMPPAAGFGLSERLFAMLVDKPVREMVFFPPMRPKKDTGE